MNTKSRLSLLQAAVRIIMPALILFSCLTLANGENVLYTWTGSESGNWNDSGNWDAAEIPDGETIDVLIDGNPAQNTTVSYATTVSSRTNGFVTVEPGDALRIGKSYSGSSSIYVTGLANRGFVRLGASASNNAQTTTFISNDSNGVFNAEGANIEIQGATTGRNRVYANFRVPCANTNNGNIVVQQPYADRNGVRLQLSETGTFVNNGLIHLRVYGGPGSWGTYFSKMEFTTTDSNPVSSILGSGRILLDMDDLLVLREGYSSISASSKSHIVTNGPQHTIEGGGTIALSPVNLGLIRASGTNGYLSVQNSPIDVHNGKAIINEPSGRLVAAGPCGMYIGTTSSAPAQFLNYGLIEARTGSFISIRKSASTSSSKNNPAATMILDGTIAGGGQFINNYRPFELAPTATLSPGDLKNDDGTGSSTAGQITFVSNLILKATTVIDLQIGHAETAGVDYDCVNVLGSLDLAGILNISALPGSGSGGTYTVFTCAPGELTDNGLEFGEISDELGRPKLTVDAEAGIVSIYLPPRATLLKLL